MGIPGQEFFILDPGLGATPAAVETPLFVGCCEKGDDYTVYALSRISDAVATLGQGPLSEAVCTYLGTTGAGGPVLAIKLPAVVPGGLPPATFNTADPPVQQTAAGFLAGTGDGTIEVSGVPFDSYAVRVLITKDATYVDDDPLLEELTPAEFSYSLDDGYTYTESFTIPNSGDPLLPATFPLPSTGLALEFGGTHARGDEKSGQCTAPFYSTVGLQLGIDAAIAASAEYAFLVLTGEAATSDAMGGGAGLAVAAGAHCGAQQLRFLFVRAIVAAGASSTADTIVDFAAVAHTRVLVTYGQCDVLTRKPIAGWGYPRRPIVDVVAARAGSSLISSDLGRVAAGSLEGGVAITHDEARTEVMDQKRFTTLRQIQGLNGFYITQGRLMSPIGSDYKYWQHGRVMDVACDTTYKAQLPFLNESVRTNANGTIDERDAARFEEPVNAALTGNLMEPSSAAGTPGHVSAFAYRIDRNNNLLSTNTMKTTVAIRPRGYVKTIVTELGFTANVGGG